MIRVFIVDDEPLARDELKYLLRRTKRVEIVGEADNLEDALHGIQKTQPEAVFLDIQLAEESGMDIAAKLRTEPQQPAIVFATAYDEYALRAFELDALDYILKPFDERRIQQTVDRLERLDKRPEQARSAVGAVIPALPGRQQAPAGSLDRSNRLAITIDERIILIHLERIMYIGIEEGKVLIVTDDKRYTVSETLSVLERRVQSCTLMKRVHRAYIVNVDRINEIEPWFNSTCQLRMQDGTLIPVSRTYMKELKQVLGI